MSRYLGILFEALLVVIFCGSALWAGFALWSLFS
jgi:hypothetical protein